jgi:hypothetical protein
MNVFIYLIKYLTNHNFYLSKYYLNSFWNLDTFGAITALQYP